MKNLYPYKCTELHTDISKTGGAVRFSKPPKKPFFGALISPNLLGLGWWDNFFQTWFVERNYISKTEKNRKVRLELEKWKPKFLGVSGFYCNYRGNRYNSVSGGANPKTETYVEQQSLPYVPTKFETDIFRIDGAIHFGRYPPEKRDL